MASGSAELLKRILSCTTDADEDEDEDDDGDEDEDADEDEDEDDDDEDEDEDDDDEDEDEDDDDEDDDGSADGDADGDAEKPSVRMSPLRITTELERRENSNPPTAARTAPPSGAVLSRKVRASSPLP